MTEMWKPIPGWEGSYEVSDLGRVRSLDRLVLRPTVGNVARRRGCVLALKSDPRGYPLVVLYRPGGKKRHYVHRLVLEAFVGPAPAGHVACHANDVKTDNRLANLRWDTESANVQDCLRNGKHGFASMTHCRRGHEFDEANTYWTRRGSRTCRSCIALRARERAAALRATAA